MRTIPTEISWEGLKRVKVKNKGTGYEAHEFRIGKKALRMISSYYVFRLEKQTNGYHGSRSDELRINFTERGVPKGEPRNYGVIYLDYDNVQVLVDWLLEGKYRPPQRRECGGGG